jgi:hypothetical protein
MPAVRPTPAEESEEFLPIFASVESAWFKKSEPAPPGSDAAAQSVWSKPDAGWSAAEAIREPAKGGTTQAGLPKRVPKANLVPGQAGSGGAGTPSVPPAAGVPAAPAGLSPERVRSRLSSFQQAVRQGRADAQRTQQEGS